MEEDSMSKIYVDSEKQVGFQLKEMKREHWLLIILKC